jgi:hypothetical protein
MAADPEQHAEATNDDANAGHRDQSCSINAAHIQAGDGTKSIVLSET